jgi:hypothetical protein
MIQKQALEVEDEGQTTYTPDGLAGGGAASDIDMKKSLSLLPPVGQRRPRCRWCLLAIVDQVFVAKVLAQPVHTPESWDLAARIAKDVQTCRRAYPASCRSSRSPSLLKTAGSSPVHWDLHFSIPAMVWTLLRGARWCCNRYGSPAAEVVEQGRPYIVQPGNVRYWVRTWGVAEGAGCIHRIQADEVTFGFQPHNSTTWWICGTPLDSSTSCYKLLPYAVTQGRPTDVQAKN